MHTIKYFFTSLTIFCCISLCLANKTKIDSAQNSSQRKIDSIQNLLQNAKQDTEHLQMQLLFYKFTFAYDRQEHNKAIDLGKKLIKRYEATRNPEDKDFFLEVLSGLRIPYRVSDRLDEGFDYYTSKLNLYLRWNDSAAISRCYYVESGFYTAKGLYDLAIYNMKKSVSYLKRNDLVDQGSLSGLAGWANNTSVLGYYYNQAGDYQNAIPYLREAQDAYLYKLKDSSTLSFILNNLSYSKMMLNETDSVLEYLNRAINISIADSSGGTSSYLASSYQVKGIFFLNQGILDSAELYLKKCNSVINKYHLPAQASGGILNPNYYLALVRVKQTRFKDAEELIKTDLPRIKNLRSEKLKEYQLLINIYLSMGDVKKANETFMQYNVLQEQLKADERKNRLISFETERDINQAESSIENLKTEKQFASVTRNYLMGVAGLLLVLAMVLYNRFRVKRKANVALEEKNKIISDKNGVISTLYTDITDSINYARRIQLAKLPNKAEIYSSLPNSFILYKPKAVVSGDFYFFHKSKNSVFIASADCTGHGVPGAFMSMICSDKLEDAVLQSSDTSEILKQLNKGIRTSLRQSNNDESTRDGMDIVLCSVDIKNCIVKYAGANRPLWIIRKGETSVEEIKATKKAIGGFTEDDQHFESHEIKLDHGDTIYLTTDGYADTFSGKDGKKLKTKRFKEILLGIHDKTMQEQERYLDDFIENWKGQIEQVDDILVIGVRL
jgi:serine phosphatase RsbU (regulator of sigma subunit)